MKLILTEVEIIEACKQYALLKTDNVLSFDKATFKHEWDDYAEVAENFTVEIELK